MADRTAIAPGAGLLALAVLMTGGTPAGRAQVKTNVPDEVAGARPATRRCRS